MNSKALRFYAKKYNLLPSGNPDMKGMDAKQK